jgi:hypothetical protein
MNRLLIGGFIGALLGAGLGVFIAAADDGESSIFIASDQPITEGQVREKLQSEGWLNVQVTEQGRYFEATGAKGGRARKIVIDSLTGQLIEDDDDD